MTSYSRGEFLALLLAMTADTDRPDLRPQAQIAEDMRLEQLAEERKAARTTPSSDRDAEWLARRWAG